MPTPKDGETEDEFVQRCIPIVIDEGTAEDGKQGAAICHSMWREHQKEGKALHLEADAWYSLGEPVKALAEPVDGKLPVGSYGIRYGSPEERDMVDDWFAPDTDYGPHRGDGMATTFHHCIPVKAGLEHLAARTFAPVKATPDDMGIFVEAVLDLADEYERTIAGLAQKGKLRWSSGTAAHLILRDEQSGKIERWPIVEWAYTPTAAEPRLPPIAPIKALSGATYPELEPEADAVEATAAKDTDGHVTVNITINDTSGGRKSTQEVLPMSEKEETVQTPEPVDVEAVAAAAATQAVKTLWESLENEPPVKLPGLRVTGDEADRALEGNPFKTFGEMSMAVKDAGQRRNIDKRLLPLQSPDGYTIPAPFLKSIKAVSGMSEGAGPGGGFLVGTDQRLGVISRDWNVGQLLGRVSNFPVSASSNAMTFNLEAETSRVAGSRRGGVRGYWAAEAGDKTSSYPTFRQLDLKLKKAVALVYATDELLADATALESYLMQVYPEELMFLVEDAIINGTGVGMPLGILPSGAIYSVPKEVGQAADTVVSQNVIKMWTHRWVGKSDYVWLINQEVEAQLMQMALGVGTGGLPVYLPPGGLSAAPYGSIFGRPVLTLEYCAAVGTVGDIMLISPSEYYMITKGGTESASSIHYRFINDETVFRFVYRVDGQPSWTTPLTPFKGTASSISPFVVLASRD